MRYCEMHFDSSYFEDETREGFYIPGMVKRSWAVQMEVLNVIADICEKNGIRWFADCGTLLGAVRHGGFIPWDDDLDICMLREDYIRFNKVVRDSVPEGYRVLNLEFEDEYDNFITRVTNSSAIGIGVDYLKNNHGFPYVAGVDIFPLDYLMENDENEEERRVQAYTLWNLAEDIKKEKVKLSDDELAACVHEIAGITLDSRLPQVARLLRVIEKVFKKYDGEKSDKVALMPYYIKNKGHIYPTEYFRESVRLPFEQMLINVPAAYSDVLTIEYGNWFEVSKKGGVHDYPFYSEQEKILLANKGTVPYHYVFSGIDKSIEEDRKKHAILTDEKAKLLSSLDDKHQQVITFIDKKNIPMAMNLLVQCQDVAITVGTAIDEEQGDGQPTVNLLENYCEMVYELHEKLVASERVNTYQERKKLSKLLMAIQDSYRNDIKRNGKIIFMPVKASDWSGMERLYNEFVTNSENDVYVMPVPYAKRDDNGIPLTEAEAETGFPENLPLIKYSQFDFNKEHPDMLVIQNPFDEYESGMTVHPFFYAKNLIKYTNRLVYCHSFLIDDIEDGDEKSLATAKQYIVSPGVLYSDEIYVPSDNIRSVYLKVLCSMTGESSEQEWEQKIKVLKSEASEDRDTLGEISNKKKILFYTGLSDYYVYKDVAIEWVRNSLKKFEAQKDRLDVIWVQEDELGDNLAVVCPSVYEQYIDLRERFVANNNGSISSIRDIKKLISSTDAYYGSAGYVMNLCTREKIPVMMRNL